jgi:hypothetical protein
MENCLPVLIQGRSRLKRDLLLGSRKRKGFEMKTKKVLFSLVLTAVLVSASSCTNGTDAPALSGATGPTATVTATPPEPPTPSPTPEVMATQNTEATKQAEFETRKAEAFKMVAIKLDSPEDFNTLPVLDDVNDFDSGKVQAEERWLIENVLPPADIKLPESWNSSCNDATGFCTIVLHLKNYHNCEDSAIA